METDDSGDTRFKLLGPVGMVSPSNQLVSGGTRLRTLLAVLLVKTGETVTKEQLVDELWGDGIPATAENALQASVARLRRLMRCVLGAGYAADRLVTRPGGYQLVVEPDDVDVNRFDRLVAESRDMIAHDPERAAAVLAKALSLWEGPPLQGVKGGAICRSAALQCEENWLTAMENKIEADILVGHATQAISVLKKMAFLHPWRERLTDLLMVSLYRVGRQAEAVAAYNHARTRLVDELGMEPSPLLQRRMREILNHDPALNNVGARSAA